MDTVKKRMVLRIFALPPCFVSRIPHRALRPAGLVPRFFRRGSPGRYQDTARYLGTGRQEPA
ncbi:MAG TPA: hypothetical protein P5286_05360, partial [Treponemataceae bacterium]|nr:hypothetical protein [Treponemataceae bacterium]